jgi:putative FmdB family regulatory protein
MGELAYLCQQCGHIFRVPVVSGAPLEEERNCPACGNSQVKEIPSWVPFGSDLYEGPRKWEYECQQCQNKFSLPVPSSPSLEKNIRCPACGGRHIHRLTSTGYEPLYCG